MSKEILNARINNTKLGRCGGYVNTFYVCVEGAGWGCGIGGRPIEGKLEDGTRGYSAKGLEAMMRICEVVGVENWEDLKGKYCRVEIDRTRATVDVIGNIVNDNWFDLKEFFKEKIA